MFGFPVCFVVFCLFSFCFVFCFLGGGFAFCFGGNVLLYVSFLFLFFCFLFVFFPANDFVDGELFRSVLYNIYQSMSCVRQKQSFLQGALYLAKLY